MKTILYLTLISTTLLLVYACDSSKTIKEEPKKENSNRKFIENQLKVLDQPQGYFNNLNLTYLYDLDTISKDSFDKLDYDSIYHIFQEIDFKFISKDSILRNVTLNSVSFEYYRTHTFKPTFLEVSYYSDNLLSLNLGSKEHGKMSCEMFDKATGVRISGFNKDNYQGSFFLGSMTKHDTFKEIRMLLKIDTLLYEQSYLTKYIDDRTIDEDLEN